ncbi:hypothetical protein [Rhodobacter sp. NSM]|uniref:hypothetical protein n=1 Tax=Rhodobacter sp. NSM TaxID=3457501 RepID=UPI003FD58A1F
MGIETHTDVEHWLKPARPEDAAEPGYDAWLEAEIAAGTAELDAGRVATLEQVKKEFGLE